MLDFAHDPSGPTNIQKAAAALLDPESKFHFNMSVWLTTTGLADKWSICGCIAGLCTLLASGFDVRTTFSTQEEAEAAIRRAVDQGPVEAVAREWLGIDRHTSNILFDPHWAHHARHQRGVTNMTMAEFASMELMSVSAGNEPWEYSPTGACPAVTMHPLPGESIDEQVRRHSRSGPIRVVHMDLTEIEERYAALCERPVIREVVREEMGSVTFEPCESPVRLNPVRYTERPMTDVEFARYRAAQRAYSSPPWEVSPARVLEDA